MQLTRFTDLGLRTMMLLAAGEAEDQRVTTRSIAVGANASENHIAKAVARLADLGMVYARRGRVGGLTLTDAGRHTSIGWLVRRLEGDREVIECGGANPCPYVSVGITLSDGARQLRQFSLVNAPGTEELTFAVKPVGATNDQPAGEVSTWIAANVCVGDILDVTVPFGDLPAPAGGEPLVLISAGIGVTPMIGILEFLAAQAPGTTVRVLHADRSDRNHPLRKRQQELLAQLPNATLDIWYEDGLTAGQAGVHPGLLTLEGIELPDAAQVYLCGNNGLVQAVRSQLVASGVPAARVHCELFSPNDWLLS
jgi:ferredoxin-NADP reductase